VETRDVERRQGFRTGRDARTTTASNLGTSGARNPHITASPLPSYKDEAAVFFLTKQEPNQSNVGL
jgi:hypothetical protein